MPRKKPITVHEASIALACNACGVEFFVSPAKLEKNKSAACPRCKVVRYFTDDQVLRLRSENVANLTAAVEELRKR